jgi:hypothetical protein
VAPHGTLGKYPLGIEELGNGAKNRKVKKKIPASAVSAVISLRLGVRVFGERSETEVGGGDWDVDGYVAVRGGMQAAQARACAAVLFGV